jgi:ligand-binding sensor domain-containing protein
MKTREEGKKKTEEDEASTWVKEDPGDDVWAGSSFALRNMMPQGLLQLQLLNFSNYHHLRG